MGRVPHIVTVLIVLMASLWAGPTGAAKESEAHGHLKKGMRALERGKPNKARDHFLEATQLAPGWSLGFLHLGMAALQLDPTSKETRDALRSAVSLAPTNPRAHYYLGQAYQSTGDNARAEAAYAKCLQLRSKFRDAQFRLATVLEAQNKVDLAIAAYNKVLERDRTHTGTLAALARLYENRAMLEEAERALLRITRIHGDVAYHHYRLAQFYERAGKPNKARQAMRHAESLDPRPQRKMRDLRKSRR